MRNRMPARLNHMNQPIPKAIHYRAVRPLNGDFWRRESCREHNCPHYLNGWVTTADPLTDWGQLQVDYVRKESKREFWETRLGSGLIEFRFASGQACFRQHQHLKPLERDPLFVKEHGGDRKIITPDEHITTMNEQLHQLKRLQEGG